MLPLEVSLALRNVEFAVESMVSSIGLTLPFSSAWKIWLAASTRRGKREDRFCDTLQARGRGKGGKGRSWAVDVDAKFCLASSTTSVVGTVLTMQEEDMRENTYSQRFASKWPSYPFESQPRYGHFQQHS